LLILQYHTKYPLNAEPVLNSNQLNNDFIKITEPQTPQEFEAYFLLRYNILRKPWNQPFGSEKDEQEGQCIHAMACDKNKNVVGVCRLQFNSAGEAQIRYMAVKDDVQGMGVGRKLIDFLECKVRQKNTKKIILQSRENAVEFYKKNGYVIIEKSYLLWGQIQHYLMEKQL
jgi:predicted GNAT family N-acyltransferase